MNSHGVTTRPSNVRVCRFRHPRTKRGASRRKRYYSIPHGAKSMLFCQNYGCGHAARTFLQHRAPLRKAHRPAAVCAGENAALPGSIRHAAPAGKAGLRAVRQRPCGHIAGPSYHRCRNRHTGCEAVLFSAFDAKSGCAFPIKFTKRTRPVFGILPLAPDGRRMVI